jgi:hypothetical protein
MQADDGTAKSRETRSRINHRTGKRVFIRDAPFWQTHVALGATGRRILRKQRTSSITSSVN